MNLHEVIVDCITHAGCQRVSPRCWAVELRQGEVSDGKRHSGRERRRRFVHRARRERGRAAGSISCTPALACRICSQMLMTESTAVDEEVLDAVAELTNMIIGSVKTDLEQHLGPLGLSIPTVVFGRNFKNQKRRNCRVDRGALPLGRRVPARQVVPGAAERAAHPHMPVAAHPCSLDV